MTMHEFRAMGHDFVLQHFQEDARTRLAERDAINVLQKGEAAKVISNRRAVEIASDSEGNLILSPKEVTGSDLADLRSVRSDSHRTIAVGCSAEIFWSAFDAALSSAP